MGEREQHTEALLAAIVSSSDDAIVSKDLEGTILTWNAGAERMFGFTPEEAVGRHISIIIPPERLSEEDRVIAQIRRGLRIDHYETVRQRKDGGLVDISLTVSPIRDGSGTIVGASKIARDITEQKRLRASVDEANRLKDEFLAVLSHELRTPLNTVLGYARMLHNDRSRMTAEQCEQAFGALERNAEVLTRLVTDVLETSRIVTGKVRLTLTACRMDEIVAIAVDTIGPAADAKGVRIDTHLEQHLDVLGDPDRLQQVVWNVVANAVKFTPGGGTILVNARTIDGQVQISVRDTGIGIASEHLPYIFQRFWQGNRGVSREYSGLGLGLAFARHLVELHGGGIVAESAGAGKGSLFTITLPTQGRMLARERNLRSASR